MNEQFKKFIKIFIKHFLSGLVISNIPFVLIGMFMGFRVVFLASLISSLTVYSNSTIVKSKYKLIGLGLLSSLISGIAISFLMFGFKETAITTGMNVTFRFGAISMILWSLCLPLIHKYKVQISTLGNNNE